MKLLTLLIGMILGAGAVFIYHLVARPIFWQNPVDVIEIKWSSATKLVFTTQEATKKAFTVTKDTRCYSLEDESSAFAILDPKDYTVHEMFVICPGLGAGWVSGL
jgi:hypothetical protein